MAIKYAHSKTPNNFKLTRERNRRKSANHVTAERMYGAVGTDSLVYGGVLNVAYTGATGIIAKTRRGGARSVA